METDIHNRVLEEVRKDIADLEERLESLRAVEKYHAEKSRFRAVLKTPALPGAPAVNGNQSNRFVNMGQREAAIVVMQEAGHPMRAGDIARKMVAGGYKYASVGKLANSLFTSFNRGPNQFRKAGPGLWELLSQNGTHKKIDDD